VGKKPHPDMELADFVLQNFGKKELETINAAIQTAHKAIESIITDGIDNAMGLYSK
jgi:PTH1 family peptidyl-tRNA hydrolase